MEYNKCELYPRCQFSECVCYDKEALKSMGKGRKRKKVSNEGKKIKGFEMVDGVLKPVYY
jgi:hypothetical protein